MKKLRGIGAAALAAVALSLLLCSPASAAEKAIWGPTELPGGGSAFPTYRDLGVDTYQMALDMSEVSSTRPANPSDPADPAYQWPAGIDRAIREATASGIRVSLLATKTPPWANGGQSPIHAPDPADFAAMMSAAAKRYPYVKRWQIWGEPNRDDRFLPNTENGAAGPRAYAPILEASYQALKRVSPKNIVIGGMTWTGGTVKPADFLRYMRLANGKPPRLDWFGHNPFPFRFPNLAELPISGGWRDVSDLDTFGQELRAVYGKRAKFWLSEFLVPSDKNSREFMNQVSRGEQARWLAAAFRIADDLPQVAGIGWLGLLDEPEAPGSANYGLLAASGARKPAYDAFRDAAGVRYRPAVRAPKRVRAAGVKAGRLRVKVGPKLSGRVRLELYRKNRRVAKGSRQLNVGRAAYVRLRYRRAKRGRYELVIRAPRGETVRRPVRFR
ncbi:MAG: hypothetical protein H0T19_06310 [Thermoleophilaceae bacterium]|nr:hypothetical protein [Thermoleophilaceae bacterium]